MPKSKEERERHLSDAVFDEANTVEAKIENCLENNRSTRRIINLTESVSELAVAELKRRYEAAGWNFTYNSDQRDGCWIELL